MFDFFILVPYITYEEKYTGNYFFCARQISLTNEW